MDQTKVKKGDKIVRFFTRDAALDSSRIAMLFMVDAQFRWFQWTQAGWKQLPDAAAQQRQSALAEGSDILMNEVTQDQAERIAAQLFPATAGAILG